MSWRSTRAAWDAEQPNRQVAVIDLGSNSWRLVVFTYSPHSWWKRTDELYETVRIGAGLGATGRLGDDAIQRGLETLGVFARFCAANEIGTDEVHAVATSAIRDADNGLEFVSAAEQATGLKIEVLPSKEEARFGYIAAVNTSTMTDGAVLEIGGGSMQLIEVADRRARELTSFQLGAVRITEEFLPGGGPAKKKDLNRVRDHVRETLVGLPWLADSGGRLVGIGGAVRNLAAAALHEHDEIDIGVQGFVITRKTLGDLVSKLASLPPSERGSVPGIKPGRGDIILASALTIETVLEIGDFAGIEVTEASLRDG
ncbi:MAG TPA: hypothetical protein VH279_01835, partial [Solirubrobacteraceae bacterium]|nr:hypothetical protein [Solirubrobacteraceae bacterium]